MMSIWNNGDLWKYLCVFSIAAVPQLLLYQGSENRVFAALLQKRKPRQVKMSRIVPRWIFLISLCCGKAVYSKIFAAELHGSKIANINTFQYNFNITVLIHLEFIRQIIFRPFFKNYSCNQANNPKNEIL